MKLYITTILTVLSLMSCKAQSGNSDNFIKKIEKTIDGASVNTDMLSDTIYFEKEGKKVAAYNIGEKESYWKKVKVSFKGTDYTIKRITAPDTTIKIYEIKNHQSLFTIQLNDQSKISIIRQVVLKLPPNSPPIIGNR